MWQRISQRLSDPVFYRKRISQLGRLLRRPRSPRPVSLGTLLAPGNDGPLLIVIAHPDDEIFPSGLICEATAKGTPVEIICLTRGEGGTTGGTSRTELGQRRENELRASASALGVSMVTFLGHVDPMADRHRTYAPAVGVDRLALQLRSIFDARLPVAIVTHGSGGEYWHPAHLLTHAAVFWAVEGRQHPRIPVITFHAWRSDHRFPGLLNRDDPADLIIDGQPHRPQRLAALEAHESQAEYFRETGGGSLEEFIDQTAIESYRVYPTLSKTTRVPVSPMPPARVSATTD